MYVLIIIKLLLLSLFKKNFKNSWMSDVEPGPDWAVSGPS